MCKHRLLAVLLCILSLPLIAAAADDSTDVATIRSAELKIAEAYKSRQVDSFASLLDDDFVITFEDGSVYSKTGYLSYSASSSTRIEVAEIADMKVRMHGDTAVVTGTYHEKGMDNRDAYDYHDRFTDVWMKKAGKWRLISAHYSVPSK
jgi:ketosteroid isomerase-like protein